MAALNDESSRTPRRAVIATAVFWVALLWSAWLLMMLLHETGHVVAAWTSGGIVQRVIWGPIGFSRTDVGPNPHPLVVVWAGPVVGSLLPLGVWAIIPRRAAAARLVAGFLAGFCLIANGGYIGVGASNPVGDAREMVRHGTPRALMLTFGILAFVGGVWLWHLVSDGASRAQWKRTADNYWVAMMMGTGLLILLAAINAVRN